MSPSTKTKTRLNELNVWTRTRPPRVAYLIDTSHSEAHSQLDAVFSECYGRWGGRFTLLVPYDRAKICDLFWPWLEHFSPDLIYSYVELTPNEIVEIYERTGAAAYKYHYHNWRDKDAHGRPPRLGVELLSSLSTLLRVAELRPVTLGKLQLLSVAQGSHPHRWYLDTFGSYQHLGGGALPAALDRVADVLHVNFPGGDPKKASLGQPLEGCLREFGQRRATSVAALSAAHASRYQYVDQEWTGFFNITVGDAVEDRILFWNSAWFCTGWLDGEFNSARLDISSIADSGTVEPLLELIRARSQNVGSRSMQTRVALQSTSLSQLDLGLIRKKLFAGDTWTPVATHAVVGLHECVPPPEVIENSQETNPDHVKGQLTSWQRLKWTPPTIKLPVRRPPHLLETPNGHPFAAGYWCSDFAIESEESGPLAQNNHWSLPPRWEMAHAFRVTLSSTRPSHAYVLRRQTRRGDLTLFEKEGAEVESIDVPTVFGALHYGLVKAGQRADTTAVHDDVARPQKVRWAEPSNEARYLYGITGLFGGLAPAASLILHPCISEIFHKLGGSSKLSETVVNSAVVRLQKSKTSSAPFDLRSSDETVALGRLVTAAARQIRKPMSFLTLSDVLKDWEEYRINYHKTHPLPEGASGLSPEWDEIERDSLFDALRELRFRKLIFQGYFWQCSDCLHRNWVDFEALRIRAECETCRRMQDAPISIDWVFRGNEFVIEALRDHSVRSTIWALSALKSRSRRSFLYVGPTWLGYEMNDKPSAEADFLAIVDGKMVVAEVKNSWADVRKTTISDLEKLSLRLKPDIAILAVMDFGERLKEEISTLKRSLAKRSVEFFMITLDTAPLDENSMFSIR